MSLPQLCVLSFISAVDYFQEEYAGTSIIFDMSMVYILSSLAAVLANNLVVEILPLEKRICFGYVVSFSVLTFVAVFKVWGDVLPVSEGYHVILVLVFLLAAGCTGRTRLFYCLVE